MRFRWMNVPVAVASYAVLLISAEENAGMGAVVFLCAYSMLSWGLLGLMLGRATLQRERGGYNFLRADAMTVMGEEYGVFSHFYCCAEPLANMLTQRIEDGLRNQLGCGEAGAVTLKDIDKELGKPESRAFRRFVFPTDAYGTVCSMVYTQTVTGKAQSIRWWLLAQGPRNPNALFWMYVWAPLGNLFKLKEFVLRGYFPLSRLHVIRPGTFTALDVSNRLSEANTVAFDVFVDTLDEHGVDTSSLKVKSANALNINISGGTASFNNVVQGAMTKMFGKA